MKKWWIVLIVALTVAGGYAVFRVGVKQGKINRNSIQVEADKPLDKAKVKIIKSYFSIDRRNDAEMFREWSEEEIVFNKDKTERPAIAGVENDFLIIYNDTHYFQFRQFKTDRELNDTYRFHLAQTDTSIYLDVKIEPNGLVFRRKMNLIKNASKMLANQPIDSVGYEYNGIELR
ncbi:hypothetical protein WSM22_18880 [Cytophagales bacterium WSM2-2]|nr:hypothetical protein WSM22_18880 [Cytophagales bacterium WSM2-2]